MKKLSIIIIVVITLGLGWWLGSPLFLEKEVNEDFPGNIVSQNADPDVEMTLNEFDKMMVIPTESELEDMSEEEKMEMEKEMLEKAATMPIEVMEKMEESQEPELISQGNFFDGDDFHKGSGNAKLFKMPDGSHLVRLEDFEVTNGPDLYVYLTNASGAKTSAEVKGGYNAGRLKGNKGNQNYVIPADIDVSDYNGISIYCRAFSVLFSSANLQ